MNYELFKRRLLNIIFPIECISCGREDVWLCNDCLLKLPLGRNANCFFCGKNDPPGFTCDSCAANHYLDGVFVCADYDNHVVAGLIKKLKYSFARELGEVLGEIAARYLKKLSAEEKLGKINLQKFTVMPIPLHKKRLAWRGFNQSEMIARYLVTQLGLPYQDELVRVKHKTPQVKLGGVERKKNIKDCFEWRGENLNGKNILLIDDVATTGSTLAEAVRVLKTAGAGKVWGLVIAKG